MQLRCLEINKLLCCHKTDTTGWDTSFQYHRSEVVLSRTYKAAATAPIQQADKPALVSFSHGLVTLMLWIY